MIDLSTRYLGLQLRTPLIVSASPLSDTISQVRQMEDAGASAVVLHSLFEEQITRHHYDVDYLSEADTEETSFFPDNNRYILGPHGYLAYIRRLKSIVDIPVIGSLNGFTTDSWIRYAQLIEEAGADALELNIYYMATDPSMTGAYVELLYFNIVRAIKQMVTIPVAVKLSPYFSAMLNMALKLEEAGADGLVLFNRFYQPDINLESLTVAPDLTLSTSSELRLRLRWVALLYPHLQTDMVITGGVHTAEDALKAMLVGARAVMMTSALMQHGLGYLGDICDGMTRWLQEHDYVSLQAIHGRLRQDAIPNPTAYERANYIRTLQSYEEGE